MKYVRIFEDYSPEEIEDLLGDLETIGHKYRLVPGEDFGFGFDRRNNGYMKRQNDGRNSLMIKKEVVEDLVERGVMERYKNTPGDVYFTNDANLSLKYPMYYFNQIFFDNRPTRDSDYALDVKHNFRMNVNERFKAYKDFSQEIVDYLSGIKI
jgi:hypothetical protein